MLQTRPLVDIISADISACDILTTLRLLRMLTTLH
jgi:hypothetical protein